VAGRFWHDPWHLAQALSDPHLRFAVVERREVEAATPRANALRDIMTSRARMVREVPQCPTDVSDAVRVYEFVPLALKEAAR
jgi:hypothetical protein